MVYFLSVFFLVQAGSSESIVEARILESYPASDQMKKTPADGDDDEISFKISPVLAENFGSRQVVPRLKRPRIEVEEEETAAKEEATTAEVPKRTQRSIFQWLKKTPASPSAAANTNKRTSNSSSGSNNSEVDFGTKLSVPDPPSTTKRRGAKSPLVPASGSENDEAGHTSVADAATASRGRGRPRR